MTQAQTSAELTQAYAAGALGFRNKIINPCGIVNQRGLTGVTAAAAYLTDRWMFSPSPAIAAGKANFSSQSAPASGISLNSFNTMYLWSLASYALVASDYCAATQLIEGYNIADLLWGTALAKPISVSLRAIGPAGFVVAVSIRNKNSDRSYVHTLTMTGAPTTYKFTVPGDTQGTWEHGYLAGIQFWINVACGATYATSSKDTWLAGNFVGTTDSSNLMSAASQSVEFSDVQVESGPIATPFEVRPIALEMAMCQRYYQRLLTAAQGSGCIVAVNTDDSTAFVWTPFNPMRTSPTLNVVGAPQVNTKGANKTFSTASAGSNFLQLGFGGTVTGSGGASGYMSYSAAGTGYLELNAEL